LQFDIRAKEKKGRLESGLRAGLSEKYSATFHIKGRQEKGGKEAKSIEVGIHQCSKNPKLNYICVCKPDIYA
jgi:hypothetical protein